MELEKRVAKLNDQVLSLHGKHNQKKHGARMKGGGGGMGGIKVGSQVVADNDILAPNGSMLVKKGQRLKVEGMEGNGGIRVREMYASGGVGPSVPLAIGRGNLSAAKPLPKRR
jgi:hypothetical protein